jgi:hypothetical protein
MPATGPECRTSELHPFDGRDEPADREIGDRKRISYEPLVTTKRSIQHRSEPGEIPLATRNKGGVGLAEAENGL